MSTVHYLSRDPHKHADGLDNHCVGMSRLTKQQSDFRYIGFASNINDHDGLPPVLIQLESIPMRRQAPVCMLFRYRIVTA